MKKELIRLVNSVTYIFEVINGHHLHNNRLSLLKTMQYIFMTLYESLYV